jgi:hypothetical protein
MLNLLNSRIKQHVTNALGSRTARKIIVIESDDWGSVRMPSRKVFDNLAKKGLAVDDPYNRYDSLATVQDLSALFEVLRSFRDHTGKHPAVTANCLVANPDFDRIRAGNFEQYFFEPFTETLQKYPGCEQSFALWQEGLEQGFFRPQFHGREHLNVLAWMSALQQKDHDALLGFDYGFWGHKIRSQNSRRSHYLAAYDFNSSEELSYVCEVAAEGMELFVKIFGYRSRSFIAPNFVWTSEIEKTLSDCGVTLVQGQRNQLIPILNAPGYQTKFHYTGQKNNLGQHYLVRNCFFEPSSEPGRDWVDSCLKDISQAFFWKTAAIISVHRVNLIGAIVPEKRECNLVLLKRLLSSILEKWPEVEFMTTDQLDNLLDCDNTK